MDSQLRSNEKKIGRLNKRYRIIWNDDHQITTWVPPLSPEEFSEVTVGKLAGTGSIW